MPAGCGKVVAAFAQPYGADEQHASRYRLVDLIEPPLIEAIGHGRDPLRITAELEDRTTDELRWHEDEIRELILLGIALVARTNLLRRQALLDAGKKSLLLLHPAADIRPDHHLVDGADAARPRLAHEDRGRN